MDKNQNQEELKNYVARLESQVDHMSAELIYLDGLLTEVGFPNGIETLKLTAEELLAEGIDLPQNYKGF